MRFRARFWRWTTQRVRRGTGQRPRAKETVSYGAKIEAPLGIRRVNEGQALGRACVRSWERTWDLDRAGILP